MALSLFFLSLFFVVPVFPFFISNPQLPVLRCVCASMPIASVQGTHHLGPAKPNQHKSRIAFSETLHHTSTVGFINTFWCDACDPTSPQLTKYMSNTCQTFKTGLSQQTSSKSVQCIVCSWHCKWCAYFVKALK